MTDWYDIAFEVSLDVDTRTVLEELARLTGLVDINLDTLEIGYDKAYFEGQYDEDDWDEILAYSEESKAVKMDHGTMAEWIDEVYGEGDE